MKKIVGLFLCLAMIVSVTCVFAETGYTILYTEDGRAEQFPDDMVYAQLTVGWYTEPVQRLYAEGKSAVFTKAQVPAQLTVGWYTEPVQRLYAEGKSALFPQSQVYAQLTVGWYIEPVQRLYAEGKSALFPQSQVYAQLAVGWYTEPVQRLFAPGKSAVFPKSKVAAQLSVGWSTEPIADPKQKMIEAAVKNFTGIWYYTYGSAPESKEDFEKIEIVYLGGDQIKINWGFLPSETATIVSENLAERIEGPTAYDGKTYRYQYFVNLSGGEPWFNWACFDAFSGEILMQPSYGGYRESDFKNLGF